MNLERLANRIGDRPDPADPARVLAMPLILRIDKAEPPRRQALLEAAARASVLACLDPRADDGGEWMAAFDAWCAARIRKVARRARGAQWHATADLPGITVSSNGAQARALVPGPVGAVDRRVSRLQIGGTELEGALASEGTEAGLCLWVAPDLPMTVGKLAAQVSHAAMLAVPLAPAAEVAAWYARGCPLAVRQADARGWRSLLAASATGHAAAVRDAGYTEVAPGSCTVIAEWITAP